MIRDPNMSPPTPELFWPKTTNHTPHFFHTFTHCIKACVNLCILCKNKMAERHFQAESRSSASGEIIAAAREISTTKICAKNHSSLVVLVQPTSSVGSGLPIIISCQSTLSDLSRSPSSKELAVRFFYLNRVMSFFVRGRTWPSSQPLLLPIDTHALFRSGERTYLHNL